MPKKQKLFFAVAPFFLAVLLVGAVLFFPRTPEKMTRQELKDVSVARNVQLFTGMELKQQAFQDKKVIPFMGSSELSRIDLMHPSVLAEKYQRDYLPFLVGAAGTSSLSHYFFLKTNEKEMYGRKAVFIISPQWFTPEGVPSDAAGKFISPMQVCDWLVNTGEINDDEAYLAKRLLKMPASTRSLVIKNFIQKVAEKKELSALEIAFVKAELAVYQREDSLFRRLTDGSIWKRVLHQEKELPKEYSYEKLDELAANKAKKQMTNNEFRIQDRFFKTRIEGGLHKLKGSQAKWSYLKSPEYNDFEMVLEEMAKLKMDVMFVIQPTNKLWTDYTGLSSEMLNDFSVKIREQLTSQGFTNVIDFTDKSTTPYFMNDTIHIGYRGWLALDKHVLDFMKQSNKAQYNIQEKKYFSKEWADFKP
ncbi:D-alanine transfer protein [Pilibacter termitis]|uniref:Protein DltD n=1 Tax=Pilibacter termitis TaxID=263852 RepID=A0A1T4M7I2_9ENTE|nr:D-alanyl-lipoteichoic acid biosynthesis protein DltD [Pilibacter termitis]SJZ62674.1 D-alanine transfer protein [Pilibacter termitis]